MSWIWQMCGYNERATENEGDDGLQEGEHLPITTLVLTLLLYQPFVWNGARHAHAHTTGKRKLGYCLKNNSVHYSS